MAFIDLTSLGKSFGPTPVVRDFDLALHQGEFVSLLGPSGCGKTTVLRMVAGFETPDSGDIRIEGQSLLRQRASQRQIGMVFQSYALFPNMTVADNVAFGLRVAKLAPAQIDKRVDEMLDMVGLAAMKGRYPYQLSGGQQQRVALARAIAPRPRVLLLDEPLSALDAKIRVALRTEIRTIQRQLGITTLFVTHDQEEALSMSDRIVIMNAGRAEQIGTPEEIYNRPTTRFVAGFIGTLNVIEGQLGTEGGTVLTCAGGRLALPGTFGASPGETLSVAVRPQSLRPAPIDGDGLRGTVRHVEFLGAFTRLHVSCGPNTLLVDCFARDLAANLSVGSQIALTVPPDEVLRLSA
ncbi:ABC transporter ATP-binding protein [Paragemmobacter straminiformis]|uniref:ABC transporter ATP-binding protein n=1 Tax=Paragemmobacter straminiformis TaxID=2045119 RepID=A0A842IA97_9RHOB|nr:ABC transporter ATP-binding protein [Gemmobacter straminiformis]MBC2836526.1 ABC transporter ATP-binding protein [Gemmobacter straminiformis]